MTQDRDRGPSITQTFELRGEECRLRVGVFDDGTAVGMKIETDEGQQVAVGLTPLDAARIAEALIAAAGHTTVPLLPNNN